MRALLVLLAISLFATLGCSDAPAPKKKATKANSSDGAGMKKLTDSQPAFNNSGDALKGPVDALGLLQAQIAYDDASKEVTGIRFPAEVTLTDDDLQHLKNLTSMTHLEIFNGKGMTGKGLANLQGFDKLQHLHIHNSGVNDEGLASFPALPRLQWLRLEHSQITGPGLVHLKDKLPAVVYFYLRWSPINGPGLQELAALDSLDYLYLNGTKIDDAGLAYCKDLKQIKLLELGNTLIKGPGVENLKGLTSLESLGLQNTGVDATCVTPLIDLVKLKTLDLNGTRTSDESVAALKGFGINWLGVKASKVTPAGIEELKKMLPNATIESQ